MTKINDIHAGRQIDAETDGCLCEKEDTKFHRFS